MQKIKFLKNPAGTDTWKITSTLSTHDTLYSTSDFLEANNRKKVSFMSKSFSVKKRKILHVKNGVKNDYRPA